ncbi:C39 family peptidase [Pseudomonas citronellolis]|uniref:C39 family peptidase n=1 Tax=Pseudomonas citronellolis TaxID=53408 RepID=UPI0023E445CB|nr:C39 family peptidase [Pseudomonas citronellolis]MDF3932341.1 C39 family peptidase [Pseudomonas citronellolis]
MRPVLSCLAIALALCCAGQVQAANQGFAVLPGGALAFKKVESLRERRFSGLVQQKTDFSCGAAALATILRQAYHLDVDEHFVIEGMLVKANADLVRTQGFSMLDMKNYVQAIGMRGRGYRVSAPSLETLKVPVIVMMEINGYKHFVVLQRANKEWVYVGDPVLGNKRYRHDDFAKGWNGIIFAVIGPGYDKDNALMSPPEPLTARNRLDRFRPVKDTELMDYGFIQSDFF